MSFPEHYRIKSRSSYSNALKRHPLISNKLCLLFSLIPLMILFFSQNFLLFRTVWIWSHPWIFLFHLELMSKSCMSHLCYKSCNLILFSLVISSQLSFLVDLNSNITAPISVAMQLQLWIILYEPHHIMSCLSAHRSSKFHPFLQRQIQVLLQGLEGLIWLDLFILLLSY